jgi:carbon monoxide dehydrogenase subunit G
LKISGQATLRGPVHRVFAALHDPAVLVRTIPGCERLERVGQDEYRMTVTAGVASIKGTYAGDVRLTDQDAPHGFTMRAAGSGAPGTVSADVRVTLAEHGDGGTLLTYDADAVIGGMIGAVGQRMLAGVAKKTAGEFFAAVDSALAVLQEGSPVGSRPQEGSPVGSRLQEGSPVDGATQQGSPLPVHAGTGQPSSAAAGLAVFTRAPREDRPAPAGVLPAGFLAGALVGAAIALTGALTGAVVGGLLTRRATRPR